MFYILLDESDNCIFINNNPAVLDGGVLYAYYIHASDYMIRRNLSQYQNNHDVDTHTPPTTTIQGIVSTIPEDVPLTTTALLHHYKQTNVYQ